MLSLVGWSTAVLLVSIAGPSAAGYKLCIFKTYYTFRFFLYLSLLSLSGIFPGIPGSLIGLFTNNPDTISAGETALRIISAGFIVSTVSVTSAVALEGLGKGFPSLIISVCRYVAVIIPVAFIMSRIVGAVGVWHAFWITEVITSVISYMVYRKNVK